MPKQVDHKKYRTELANRAAKIFSERGYNGLGMRQIAKELGISKSALYHYFPSKDALFTACTEVITSFEIVPEERENLEKLDKAEKVKALIRFFRELEKDFHGELNLMMDYLRNLSVEEVAKDKNMVLANSRYEALVASYVGIENASPILCMMYGTLLQRLFDGQQTQFEAVEKWLMDNLE